MDGKKLAKWMVFSGLGLGAAAVYLTDPKNGQKRRLALAQGAGHLVGKVRHEGEKTLRDCQNHLSGLAARLRSNTTAETPLDRVVEERVRSRMGRIVARPRRIHVLCDKGVVTLWGQAFPQEIPELIQATQAVAGVREVHDHLEAHAPQGAPALVQEHSPGAAGDLVRSARKQARLNWSPSRRLLVGSAGAALGAYGLRRNDTAGKLMTVVGAGIVASSVMRNNLSSTLSLTENSPGFEVEKVINVNAPISDLYDFWANPENYPQAFSHVSQIERLGENLYRWTLKGPAGLVVEWEGTITRAIPNTLVEFKSLPGASVGNFGVVRFHPEYDASTRIHIRMFYRPPAGILGKLVAELLGANAERILDQDLKRFKQLFEQEEFVTVKKKQQWEESELLKTATT